MSIVYNNYINNIDHTWYDSSNIIYSQCFDSKTNEKSLKIVFKAGRTYLYRNVMDTDYILFRNAASNGKTFNEIIKKYDCLRLQDTNLDELEALKNRFIQDNQKTEEITSGLCYVIEINNETGEFRLKMNDNTVFEGKEGEVSILNLFNSMNFKYRLTDMEKPILTENDFTKADGVEL